MYFLQRIKRSLVFLFLPLTIWAQSTSNIKKHTEFLSSDRLEGRGAGSKGIYLASKYIAKQFATIGLTSINQNTYLQKFPIPDQKEMASNVIGFIKGISSSTKSIVFTAHYDAYGIINSDTQKDSIYNGAQDNAVGAAALIELARLYANGKPPKHNLVFVATAGEELGLYGSQFYVNNPIFPDKEIIICLNIDGFNVSGPREDYFIFPRQGIDFADKIEAVLKPLGWHYISPDWVDDLNKSFDTASFLMSGIPSVTFWTGNQLKGGKIAESVQLGGIHTPEDEITDSWNWDGVEDHLLLYKVIADYFLENPGGIHVTDPKLFVK